MKNLKTKKLKKKRPAAAPAKARRGKTKRPAAAPAKVRSRKGKARPVVAPAKARSARGRSALGLKGKKTARTRTYAKVFLPQGIEQIIAKGKSRGFLTLNEITSQFPDFEKDITGLENLYDKLSEEGIEIIDRRSLLELSKGKKPKETNENRRIDSVQMYLKEIGSVSMISAKEEKEYAQRIELGDDEAKKELARANLRLVVSIAKKYIGRSPNLTLLDLIQEGNLGLFRAVEKFNWRKGYKFSTYATWWIRQAITRALADQSRTIRIPVHMVETISKFEKVRKGLLQNLGRNPLAEEIAAEMGLDISKVHQLMKIKQKSVSLETPVGDDEKDSILAEFIQDEKTPLPSVLAARNLLKERLTEISTELSAREYKILSLRFGLDDGYTHTLEEVGKEFGVTRERIRQIQAKALEKIRRLQGLKKLRDY